MVNRIERSFTANSRFYINSPGVGQLYYEARLICAGRKHSLATGSTLEETIRNTALMLFDFLTSHPECA